MTDDRGLQTGGNCIVCQRRDATHPPVCGGCRHALDDQLLELVERWTLVGAATEPSRNSEERVSGSRDRPMPGGEALNLAARGNPHTVERDLKPTYRTTGARPGRPKLDPCHAVNARLERVCVLPLGHIEKHNDGEVRWPYRQQPWHREPVTDRDGYAVLTPNGDQHGPIDPTEILWSWTRDWLTYRRAGEIGPQPDLYSIVYWLRNRLEWACDHHPAVDDFAGELWNAVDCLREVLNVKRYVQRYKEPCPRCDSKALYREVDPDRGASAWVQCGDCGNLWRESEFARLSVILDVEARRGVA